MFPTSVDFSFSQFSFRYFMGLKIKLEMKIGSDLLISSLRSSMSDYQALMEFEGNEVCYPSLYIVDSKQSSKDYANLFTLSSYYLICFQIAVGV